MSSVFLFPSLIRLSVAASLRRKTLVTADGLTKEMRVSVYLYAKEVKRLYKASGALFLALYLKQALFCLWRWSRRPHDRLPVPVSLTRSGFPRIIPSFIRRQKYKKDDKADMLVKIWLSLFHFSKIIKFAKWISQPLLPLSRLGRIQKRGSKPSTGWRKRFPSWWGGTYLGFHGSPLWKKPSRQSLRNLGFLY